MSATDDELGPGVRVILYADPENGIDSIEVGVIEAIELFERFPEEGREALVRIPFELRDPEDRDGLREVFFDTRTLFRTKVF